MSIRCVHRAVASLILTASIFGAVGARAARRPPPRRPCGSELTKSHGTSAPPNAISFRDLNHAYGLISSTREALAHYLDESDLARLQDVYNRAIERQAAGTKFNGDLRILESLVERARVDLQEDLVASAPAMREELTLTYERAVAAGNEGVARRLASALGLLGRNARTSHFAMNEQLWATFWWARELSDEDVMRSDQVEAPVLTHTVIDPNAAPRDAVTTLTFLSGVTRRQLARALGESAHSSAAIDREARRESDSFNSRGTFVPNLDRALASLLDTSPEVVSVGSKVLLRGSTRVDQRAVDFAVAFDPRDRYFTVVSIADDGRTTTGYYKLSLAVDGHLEFMSADAIPPRGARRAVGSTHFRY